MFLDHQQDQDTTERGHISPDSCCLDNSASHYPTQMHPDLTGSSPYGSCHQQQGLNHPHSVSYNNSFETESDTSYVSSSTSPSTAFMDPYESATSEEQFHPAHNQSYYCHSLPSNRSEKVVKPVKQYNLTGVRVLSLFNCSRLCFWSYFTKNAIGAIVTGAICTY